ncbi:MAG: hypothetical protein B6242_11245 [Anaerolineaceae bacterium 4572_78]|nr:MAG: hypothetical protein B6242_11245 [Anaerolineaceae bacterium 4572_78]
MNVTFLTGEYPPMQGGIADYTANLVHHIQHQQISSSILISRRWQEYDTDTLSLVYPVLSNWGWRLWWQVSKFLQKHPSDILHIQYQAGAYELKGGINWLPFYLKQWSNCPKIITTFHDLRIPYLFPKAGFLRWRAILALARYSDAVITTNHEDMTTLQQYDLATHMHQIPLGNNIKVNPPSDYDRQAWRTKLGFSPKTFVLAYFGFLNESKGGKELINVLNQLIKRGIDAHLLMIGGKFGDSDPTNIAYATQIESLIEKYNLSHHITFTGYADLSHVSAYLLSADAALLPYHDGVSFRRTTLIAMLKHGLPIISTKPTMPLPQIIPNKTMLLATAYDIRTLTESVMLLIHDDTLRKKLSIESKLLGETFNWDMISQKTADLYRKQAY